MWRNTVSLHFVLILTCWFPVRCRSAEGFIEKHLGVEGRIQSVTIADFDRDSRPDIAVRTHDALTVLLNAGGGNFWQSTKTALPWGYTSVGVTDYGVARAEVAADFNNDGRLDLAIRDRNEILFGTGDGTFLPPQPIRGEFTFLFGLTAAGDFNADQKFDLVFFVRGSLAILLGNGDGTFRSGATAELGGDGQMLVADFNRDGRSDLAYLHYPQIGNLIAAGRWWFPLNCCGVTIFLGHLDGELKESARLGVWPGSILAGDFNGDGAPDIVAANGVLFGKGDGGFDAGPHLAYADPDWYQLPAGPAAAVDLNGDAVVDLVYFDTMEGRTIAGFQGIGDGTFVPANSSSLWFHLWLGEDRRVAGTADFDDDGKPDVLTAMYCALQVPGSSNSSYPGCINNPNNMIVFLNRVERAH